MKLKKGEAAGLRLLAQKLKWEGGLDGGFSYFGDEIPEDYTLPAEFRAAWKTAYDAVEAVRAMIPEVED